MMPRRSHDLVYIPRIWPVLAISTGIAFAIWFAAILLGHAPALLWFVAVAFCLGLATFAVLVLLKYRIFIIAPEAWELPLFRISVGLCWGAFMLFLLLGLFYRMMSNHALESTATSREIQLAMMKNASSHLPLGFGSGDSVYFR
jgi:hypothetical protein